MHIFNTKATNLVLQETDLTNALVNPKGQPRIFYEMDQFLEYQNGKFKRFQIHCGSSLQESDDMFWLHALLVDTLRKIRSPINQIIIGSKKDGYQPKKDYFIIF